MRRAFTLVELMMAIVLLSIIMLFLYQTLSTLQSGNRFYAKKLENIKEENKLVKTLYLDLSLAKKGSVTIRSKDKDHDIIFMQTNHSIHQRIMPYVGYIINNEGFFRIESSQKLVSPLAYDTELSVDMFEDVRKLRVYTTKTHALVNLNLDNEMDTIFKVRFLNTYSKD